MRARGSRLPPRRQRFRPRVYQRGALAGSFTRAAASDAKPQDNTASVSPQRLAKARFCVRCKRLQDACSCQPVEQTSVVRKYAITGHHRTPSALPVIYTPARRDEDGGTDRLANTLIAVARESVATAVDSKQRSEARVARDPSRRSSPGGPPNPFPHTTVTAPAGKPVPLRNVAASASHGGMAAGGSVHVSPPLEEKQAVDVDGGADTEDEVPSPTTPDGPVRPPPGDLARTLVSSYLQQVSRPKRGAVGQRLVRMKRAASPHSMPVANVHLSPLPGLHETQTTPSPTPMTQPVVHPATAAGTGAGASSTVSSEIRAGGDPLLSVDASSHHRLSSRKVKMDALSIGKPLRPPGRRYAGTGSMDVELDSWHGQSGVRVPSRGHVKVTEGLHLEDLDRNPRPVVRRHSSGDSIGVKLPQLVLDRDSLSSEELMMWGNEALRPPTLQVISPNVPDHRMVSSGRGRIPVMAPTPTTFSTSLDIPGSKLAAVWEVDTDSEEPTVAMFEFEKHKRGRSDEHAEGEPAGQDDARETRRAGDKQTGDTHRSRQRSRSRNKSRSRSRSRSRDRSSASRGGKHTRNSSSRQRIRLRGEHRKPRSTDRQSSVDRQTSLSPPRSPVVMTSRGSQSDNELSHLTSALAERGRLDEHGKPDTPLSPVNIGLLRRLTGQSHLNITEIPYFAQGDLTHYTPDSIQKRQALRFDPDVEKALFKFWRALRLTFVTIRKEVVEKVEVRPSQDGRSGPSTSRKPGRFRWVRRVVESRVPVLPFKEYLAVHVRMQKALYRKYDAEKAKVRALTDWVRDSHESGRAYITEAQWLDGLFEVVDLWTVSVDKAEYLHFLNILYRRVMQSEWDEDAFPSLTETSDAMERKSVQDPPPSRRKKKRAGLRRDIGKIKFISPHTHATGVANSPSKRQLIDLAASHDSGSESESSTPRRQRSSHRVSSASRRANHWNTNRGRGDGLFNAPLPSVHRGKGRQKVHPGEFFVSLRDYNRKVREQHRLNSSRESSPPRTPRRQRSGGGRPRSGARPRSAKHSPRKKLSRGLTGGAASRSPSPARVRTPVELGDGLTRRGSLSARESSGTEGKSFLEVGMASDNPASPGPQAVSFMGSLGRKGHRYRSGVRFIRSLNNVNARSERSESERDDGDTDVVVHQL